MAMTTTTTIAKPSRNGEKSEVNDDAAIGAGAAVYIGVDVGTAAEGEGVKGAVDGTSVGAAVGIGVGIPTDAVAVGIGGEVPAVVPSGIVGVGVPLT